MISIFARLIFNKIFVNSLLFLMRKIFSSLLSFFVLFSIQENENDRDIIQIEGT